jgi:hypothetical protein
MFDGLESGRTIRIAPTGARAELLSLKSTIVAMPRAEPGISRGGSAIDPLSGPGMQKGVLSGIV